MKKFFGFILTFVLALTVGVTFKIASSNFGAEQTDIVAADTLQNHAVGVVTKIITQTDAMGNEVQIEVTHDVQAGKYIMIDETRNIFLADVQNTNAFDPTQGFLSISDDGTESFDPVAVSAWNNVVKTYDFYANGNLGVSIRGVDGNNDTISGNYEQRGEYIIRVWIHYQRNYDNAFCSTDLETKIATIAIGDGSRWGNLQDPAKALDVLGHEYQHAITKYYSGLEYEGESGAIDEAISDIIGALIEGDTGDDFWTVAEDAMSEMAVRQGKTNLRSTIGGTQGQRYTASQKFVCGERGHGSGTHTQDANCDYNGVHFNSTILTHLQYNICQAMPEYFTNERIGKLWFNTMDKLQRYSNFQDFIDKYLQTAIELDFSDEAISTITTCMVESGFNPQTFHKVQFVDYDGTELASYMISSGSELDGVIPTPSREDTDQYDYTFIGWDKEIPAVITEDIVFTAQYKVDVLQYTVTIIDMVGSVVSTIDYDYGTVFDQTNLLEPTSLGAKWTFVGYFADDAYTTAVQGFTLTEDITLYAYWEYQTPSTQPDDGGEEETPEKPSNCGTVAAPSIGGNNGGGGLMIGFVAAVSAALVAVLAKKKQRN